MPVSSGSPDQDMAGDRSAGTEGVEAAASSALGTFPLEDIVQHPLPGYVSPTAIAFSPDDALVSYLFSPEGSLSRKLYVFDPETWQQRLLVTPPGGGVEEENLSTAEKLRRERVRERGLGVTRYDWSKNAAAPKIMVPLPGGVFVQDGPGAELRLCIPASTSSPILDPQMSPDGSAMAYVAGNELHVLPTAPPEAAPAGSDVAAADYNGRDGASSAQSSQDGARSGEGTASAGRPAEGREGPMDESGDGAWPPRDARQLTFGAKESGRTHGLAEYIAQEEMERRSGFWWSHDSRLIAFTEVDGSAVPLFKIVHQGKDVVGAEAEEDHAYPFAGEANVRVRLGVVSAMGGEVQWMDLNVGTGGSEGEEEEYLARVMWLPDNSLSAQVMNRAQTRLKLLRFDVSTGARTTLLVEENPVWVNLHDCFTPLHKGEGIMKGGFIWASERTGFRHLYLYSGSGACVGALTEGQWMVEAVAGVDESSQVVYFTGTADSALETHLYATRWIVEEHQTHHDEETHHHHQVASPLSFSSLTGGAAASSQGASSTMGAAGENGSRSRSRAWVAATMPQRLTQGAGRHSVVLDHALQRFVDVFDCMDAPPCVRLCSVEQGGKVLATIFEQPLQSPRLRRLRLQPPQLITIRSKDGVPLHAALYRPDERVYGPPPYRTVVSVYGGPHVQTVVNSWMAMVDMRAQYLRARGILVWKLDNRGSARRGLEFEGAIKYRMGGVDADDQATGVQWLVDQQLADPHRIGIYGWSYGGYMAAICLARYPSLFRCAVAGAPVTSWDGYDTYYTERYMGRPKDHPEVFEKSSVMKHVGGIRGKLMLVHGMIDENVHFRHTVRLINALTAAAKEYELLVFPEERHMPRGLRDRMYMEERIFEFLNRNLH